jgi:hypothetical protein
VGAQGAKPPEAGEFSEFLTLNFECPEKEINMKIIRNSTFLKCLFPHYKTNSKEEKGILDT